MNARPTTKLCSFKTHYESAFLGWRKIRFDPVAEKTTRCVCRSRGVGFSLIEILLVLAIILIMLGALVPAFTSLSSSSGRQAAVNNIINAIDQARAEAIKSGRASYLVFPILTTGDPSTLSRYNYKSYAIFCDDALNPGIPKQLSTWKILPTGVAIRSVGSAALSRLADPNSLVPTPVFRFSADPTASPTYRCLKFNSDGEVEGPQAPPTDVSLCVFEGLVRSDGSELITGSKDANGNPLASGYIAVSRSTGRPETTVAPTP